MVETHATPEGDAVPEGDGGPSAAGSRSPVDEAAERLRHRGRRLRGRLDRPRRVVLRDFLIYEIKLFLDGLKGAAMGLLTIPALVLDLLHPGDRPGHRFYRVMRLGERLDNWLSLYGVAEAAEQDPEGMFGVSRAGSPTLLGRLEAVVDSAVVGHDADRLSEDPPATETAATGDGEGDAAAAAGSAAPQTEGQAPAGTGATHAGHAGPPRAARVAGDLFDQGLEVLDRAVDVLDKPGPGTRASRDDAPAAAPDDRPDQPV